MFHEDLQISFFRTLGSANIADIICVMKDPTINTYCILVSVLYIILRRMKYKGHSFLQYIMGRGAEILYSNTL
jgi:hypothetical protein